MGALTSALTPPDKERVEEALREVLRDLPFDPGAIDLAREEHVALFNAWEQGDEDAGRIIKDLALDGLVPHAMRILKGTRSKIKTRAGAVVDLAARRGIHKQDENGVSLRAYQQTLFWEMTWPQFMEMLGRLEAQRDMLGTKVAALHVVAELRTLYPDTATPLEACERAGIDPTYIGFDRAA